MIKFQNRISLLNEENLTNQYENSRCTSSDGELRVYKCQKKIHAPIFYNMGGQNRVHITRTNRLTDKQTDGQTDRLKPIYHPKLCLPGGGV